VAAPPILARHESGRALFLPAAGRQVHVWGAWRTAWMAGYFYNDGRVKTLTDLPDVQAAAAHGPALVLVGPSERRRIEHAPGLVSRVLASGARNNVLLEVQRR